MSTTAQAEIQAFLYREAEAALAEWRERTGLSVIIEDETRDYGDGPVYWWQVRNFDLQGQLLPGWPCKASAVGFSANEAWKNFLRNYATRRLLGVS